MEHNNLGNFYIAISVACTHSLMVVDSFVIVNRASNTHSPLTHGNRIADILSQLLVAHT